MNRLILEPYPFAPMYMFGRFYYSKTQLETLVKLGMKLDKPIEHYQIPKKRRVCGKTWKEIL